MSRQKMHVITGIGTGICMRLMLALLMLLGMAGMSSAAQLLYEGQGFNDANEGVTFAMVLIPEQDIRVTDLGVCDSGLDGAGMQTARDIALWDANGNLLATATVDNSGTLQGNYRFTAITPVVLTAGQEYVLGAYFPQNYPGDKLVATVLTPAPFVSIYSSSRFIGGPALAFPPDDPAHTNPDFRIAANLLYEPVDVSPVDISGTIKTAGGLDICAMVLASGQYMFSCSPNGVMTLSDLPRETDGTVKLQIYADGFLPSVTTLTGTSVEAVTMTSAGTCPNYNPTSSPGVYPGSAGNWINISGTVALGSNNTVPVCAMVLANGQYMFSCNGNGDYNMDVPLDSNGQVTIQVYADGFAPYIVKIDEYQPVNDLLLAYAVECQ